MINEVYVFKVTIKYPMVYTNIIYFVRWTKLDGIIIFFVIITTKTTDDCPRAVFE